MTERKPAIVGVGNAIVDVLVKVDDAMIERHGLTKGGMELVFDEKAIWSLYDAAGPSVESSGGSVANTIAHIAQAGVSCGFLGKVADDQFGKVFAHDLGSLGVSVPVVPGPAEPGTGRCLVMITPDGQRTMCTYLGASVSLNPTDIAASIPAAFGIVLIEGYLWDAPEGAAAIAAVAEKAHAADARVAVTLSDPGCVERHIGEMRAFIDEHCDILLANDAEARALAQESDLEAALDHVQEAVALAAVTHSEKGSTVLAGGLRSAVAPTPVDNVVDTTGAGDAYAAGFLAGLARGASPTDCGVAGGRLAARVIQHVGARAAPGIAA